MATLFAVPFSLSDEFVVVVEVLLNTADADNRASYPCPHP
jgi:hypothetical protein